MNLEETLKDVVKPCGCSECGSITGYIYNIIGSNIYIYKRGDKLKIFFGCPLSNGQRISFEQAFESLDLQVQTSLIYHLDFFR